MSEETPQEHAGEVWMLHEAATNAHFPVRLATDEQLTRMQQDLFAQYQGYRAQANDLLSKAENALSGANLLAYEQDRRAKVKLNGAAS